MLWNDLDYEREFYMIPRDTYKSIPGRDRRSANSRSIAGANSAPTAWSSVPSRSRAPPCEWRCGCTAWRRASRSSARNTAASAANPRLYAHTISDEIHESQRALRGVARTKLTFVSDRNLQPVVGTVEKRDVKEVYIADYDGGNQRRITVGRQLNNSPTWSPDGRAIAYTSWRTGYMDVYVSRIFEGTLLTPTKGSPAAQNYLPMFSPDGTRLAFTSNRDGNPEIYVMNVDGVGVAAAHQPSRIST